MIIGTAGHIDHGKTTLVRRLTGVDTDRLKEEKARGISIELGYAYTPLAGGGVLGFIDVPGHERLVHTMLAGACGIDYALVVVAADDGVMPQTREHVAILDLLGVAAGAVALTKTDRVPAERVATVGDEVRRLLAPTALAPAACHALNATDPADPGVAALDQALRAAAAAAAPRGTTGLFRLAVDRAFSLAGHGTVVTGTVFSGRAEVGAALSLLPSGIPVRVRAIHAQNRAATEGLAGERCALNLGGVEPAAIARGDWLADPRGVAVTDRIDARLTVLAGEAPLPAYAPVHVHYGATHVTGHVLGLGAAPLAPGRSGWVQLVLERPVAAAVGERFIVRNAQASRTLGGGRFLDVEAPARRRRSPARRALLEARERLLATGELTPLLEVAPWGLSAAALMRASGAPLAPAPPAGVAEVVAGSGDEGRYWIESARWVAQGEAACGALADFHAAHPAEPGPDLGRLRRIAAPAAPQALWRALIEAAIGAGRIVRSGAWLQLPDHAAALSARDAEAAERLVPLLAAGRYSPPWVRELATRTREPENRIRQLLAGLGRAGRAYAVVPDLYYESEVVAELAQVLAALAAERGAIEAAAFRDALGLGRKRAIQILEFFDRVGYTRRVGDTHVLRGAAGWRGAR
ncbi:MAG TPA: selenocysteine-specific translation elongation factor [Steroidobacteraceae bacterium]|nr:selenocysteine-specific translation elongation factor [Steroidobacteraceae bacterium]